MSRRSDPTIKERVLELFQERFGGRARARTLAVAALDDGIYSWEEVQNRVIGSVERDICRILKETYAEGTELPLARPIPEPRDEFGKKGGEAESEDERPEDGELWVQRSLWNYDEAERVILSLNTGIKRDYAILLREHEHALDRFGKAPDILMLVEPYIRIQAGHDEQTALDLEEATASAGK